MHWLALYLPDLALEAITASGWSGDRSDRQHHIAVATDSGEVIAFSGFLATVGIHIGMTVQAATSLAPEVLIQPRQPHQETALLARLALALGQYTASITVDADGVRLDLSPSSRLFGGVSKLSKRIVATTRQVGLRRIHLAHAATATAAAILARANQPPSPRSPHPQQTPPRTPQQTSDQISLLALTHQKLDRIPIECLRLLIEPDPSPLIDLLRGIGCRQLADLRALPRQGLTRRGGRQIMSLIARAYGDEPDPQTRHEPPPTFEIGIELMHRADDAAALVFAAQRLVQPLTGWLVRQWLAASRISLTLRHETSLRHDHHDQPESTLEIALAHPSRDAAQIMLLLRERLQRSSLPAPTYAIVLRLEDAVSYAGRADALWEGTASQQDSERALVDRLSARLGSDCVQRLELVADHRPEFATRRVPAQKSLLATATGANHRTRHTANDHGTEQTTGQTTAGQTTDQNASAPIPLPTAPRPTWLLAAPLPLREQRGRPIHDGKPLTIISRAERIEAGWFDGKLVSRDYHIATSDDGCWWIYRERRTGTDRPLTINPSRHPSTATSSTAASLTASPSLPRSPRWFLHGVFG